VKSLKINLSDGIDDLDYEKNEKLHFGDDIEINRK